MTTPSGLLAWGQGGNYDAIEDRSVITVLADREGLVIAPTLTALPGLTVGLGPWGAIVYCGDNTMGVIGSRDQQTIDIPAGGAQGRTDVLWADIDPDRGTWTGALYPAGSESGRLGVLLATIGVPAGANSSAAMTLTPGRIASGGGKGLLARVINNEGGIRNANTWEGATGAAISLQSPVLEIVPGHWYRVRCTATSTVYEGGSSLEGRIGVGSRLEGQAQASALMNRGSIISYRGLGRGTHAEVEYVFQRPADAQPERRIFEGRIWAHIAGTYRYGSGSGHGDYVVLTVEDLGG